MAATREGVVDPLQTASSVSADDPCWKIFDKFMYCMTPSNQFASYYARGIPDWCPDLMSKWMICVGAKWKPQEEAERIKRDKLDRQPIGHLWEFTPTYAAEARQLYGEDVNIGAVAADGRDTRPPAMTKQSQATTG